MDQPDDESDSCVFYIEKNWYNLEVVAFKYKFICRLPKIEAKNIKNINTFSL